MGRPRRGTGYHVPETIDEQVTKYLTDVHSIEVQALRQLRTAPNIVGESELARVYADHLEETEDQERRVSARLQARGATPSKVKDVAGYAGAIGMLLFARSQPDTPGKLTAHAFSYEHMEFAAYDLLALVAGRAGDLETAELARSIREQESAMAERLAGNFDRAVEASVGEKDAKGLQDALVSYLADAHAIESQAIGLLDKGPKIAGQSDLGQVFTEHLEETRLQQELLRQRLEAHDSSPSRLKDAVMRVGALNVGAFMGAQPDTPAKLAGFAFAFEHLEIGGYEELKRVAARAGDDETVRVAETIIAEERAAAERIRAQFPPAVEATLEAQGLSA